MVLGDDDLSAVRVVGTRDGVLQDADRAYDLTLLDDPHLTALRRLARAEVAGVADDLLRLDGLVAAAHADELAVRVRDDLVDRLVQHVGAAVDGAETGEGLGQLAETVERVDVRRLAVAGHGRCVQNDTLVRRPCWLVLVAG